MTDLYSGLKLLHMTCAALTIVGLIVRGIWALTGSALLQHTATRRCAISVDTILLLSALYLAYQSGQWPGQQGWLSAKLLALLVYIGLGMVALHWGRTRLQRALALLAAIVVFSYIVAVATSRNVLPLLA